MRLFSLFILAGLLYTTTTGWGTDFEDAKKKAKKDNKMILLNFSGSDWCGPCIRMHDDIFEAKVFKEFSDKNLVLVNADFPRLKKNQLSKDKQKQNEVLADKYDPEGIFPTTCLLDADGKLIRSWVGFPPITADQFVNQLKSSGNVRQ